MNTNISSNKIKIISLGILWIMICDAVISYAMGDVYRQFKYGIIIKDSLIAIVIGMWVGNKFRDVSMYSAITFSLNYLFFYEILLNLPVSCIFNRSMSLTPDFNMFVRVTFRLLSPFIGVLIGGVLSRQNKHLTNQSS